MVGERSLSQLVVAGKLGNGFRYICKYLDL